MILFANEPPTYRDAMLRALASNEGIDAAELPAGSTLEEAIGALHPEAVVVSASEERARSLSRAVPVVNLTHGRVEQAATYLGGARHGARVLHGFSDLAGVIEHAAEEPR